MGPCYRPAPPRTPYSMGSAATLSRALFVVTLWASVMGLYVKN